MQSALYSGLARSASKPFGLIPRRRAISGPLRPSRSSARFHVFSYDELIKRDKVSLDIFCLKDESLEDSASLLDPDVIAAEIAEDLQAALDQFAAISSELKSK